MHNGRLDKSHELEEVLSKVGSGEKLEIIRLFKRGVGLSVGDDRRDIDFIHSMLRNDGSLLEPVSTKRVPSISKVYEEAEQLPLTKSFVEMPYSLEQVIHARSARRDYVDRVIPMDMLSTFLHWSCGIKRYIPAYNSGSFPVRFTPSGGGLQPWEVYVVINNVENIPQGLYHYRAQTHALEQLQQGQMRSKIAELAFEEEYLYYAGYVCIVTCLPARFYWKYGLRGYRTAHIDIGVLVQSMWYVATALKLRSLPISGFSDDGVDDFLGLDPQIEFSMILFVVGARPDTG